MNYRSCQTRIIRLFLLARRLRSKGTPLLPCHNPGTPMPLPVLPNPSLSYPYPSSCPPSPFLILLILLYPS